MKRRNIQCGRCGFTHLENVRCEDVKNKKMRNLFNRCRSNGHIYMPPLEIRITELKLRPHWVIKNIKNQ